MGWAHGIIEYEELHDLHRSHNVKSSFHEFIYYCSRHCADLSVSQVDGRYIFIRRARISPSGLSRSRIECWHRMDLSVQYAAQAGTLYVYGMD